MTATELIQQIARELNRKGHTLGSAESCTGGYISHLITEEPGVSSFYRGGIVAYHEDVKRRVLKVPPELLSQFGVVSGECARAMAQGAKAELGVDWSISTTGIAGPTGGDARNPVGTVFFGLAGPSIELEAHRIFPGRARDQVIKEASDWALNWLLKTVTDPT